VSLFITMKKSALFYFCNSSIQLKFNNKVLKISIAAVAANVREYHSFKIAFAPNQNIDRPFLKSTNMKYIFHRIPMFIMKSEVHENFVFKL
jgi:hypothetical protein